MNIEDFLLEDEESLEEDDASTEIDIDECIEGLCTLLIQNGALDLEKIYIGDKASFAEYMVITSGEAKTHVKALAEKTRIYLKSYCNCTEEGREFGEWAVVLSAGIMVHIFSKEAREYYQLEDLWKKKI